ncbi:cell wall-binding repeat-containing protein [Ornithinimicrobium faecis]|uniref:Cell wall-binding repeat-containing protein n=1 Tax=Ornithinimicrobium faecis TaxID=2934158 RepID=A0ABY4YTG6_9MICO|nr:cell wall-binding repeat-containing protein [Ornithinimicrobium sp. HY1793]USQ80068.1 cell wall-binding repeat-containing protein [Ornithinimicrobium sp. HY1793]
MRLRSSRHLVTASVTALALVMAAPVALADPIPEPEDDARGVELHTDGHSHDTDGQNVLQGLGDPFAEGLLLPDDPFVVPEDDTSGDPAPGEGVRVMPESPMDWIGSPPDPGELPAEWLTEQPAEEIVPSTGAALMTAGDGYLGGGFDALGDGPELTDAEIAAVPAPPSKTLPPTLDAAPPWFYTYSCDPNNKPGMVAFANLMANHYDRPTWWGSRSCIAGDNSQHYEGRAVDWPMNAYNAADKAIGDSVAQWLTANNGEMARRFGVQSVIWNRQSWYLYKPGSWYPYNGASPHTDHLHISFSWDGAMGRTSWWDGTPITAHDYGTCRVYRNQYAPRYQGLNGSACSTNLPNPPAAPNPVVLPGARNNYVKTAQQHLGFSGGDVDGIFGPMTLQALLTYQTNKKLPWTGVLDKATWARMLSGAPPKPEPVGVKRLAGGNRYETAAKVSELFPTGKPLYITVGQDYPDALAAAARAGSKDAPLLLAQSDNLPAPTRQAITRLKPSSVTVVGGGTAINPSVVQEIKSLTSAPVVRVTGGNRYATAANVAKTFGQRVDVVYVATGLDYPDALAGAARAGYNNGPVLLVQPGNVPAATREAMRAINPYRVVVLGGNIAINGSVANELKSLTRAKNLQRVAGPDRYSTAAELARYYPNGLDTVVIATGREFPDALSGAARAGEQAGPVLLVTADSVGSTTRDVLRYLTPKQILIVGGQGAVSNKVETILKDYVK